MAILIFFKSTNKLSFSMANLKVAEDAEGFCFHSRYECSAMIAMTEQ